MRHYAKELEKLLEKPKRYYHDQLLKKYGPFDFVKFKSVILFGAGLFIRFYIDSCNKNNIHILGIADNNKDKKGSVIDGVKIISLDELKAYPYNTPIIVTVIHDIVVMSQLRNLGFHNVWSFTFVSTLYPEKFVNPLWKSHAPTILSHPQEVMSCLQLFKDESSKNIYIASIRQRLTLESSWIQEIYKPLKLQYFDPELISLSKHEAFVDGGAYDGDTLKQFLRISRNKYDAVYCFEPDPKTYKELSVAAGLKNNHKITLYPYALGRKESVLKFKYNLGLGSRLSNSGDTNVRVVSLDKILKDKVVTFIKMDIEGAEVEALKGARQIITQQKPTLAICVYHKSADLWEIPMYIKSLGVYENIYLRKYDDSVFDIICYALKSK